MNGWTNRQTTTTPIARPLLKYGGLKSGSTTNFSACFAHKFNCRPLLWVGCTI